MRSVSAGTLRCTDSLRKAELNPDPFGNLRADPRVQPVIKPKERLTVTSDHLLPLWADLTSATDRWWGRGCAAGGLSERAEEERPDCLRPLVLTGLSFNSICSITAVCVEPRSIGRHIQETLTGKQAVSLWSGQWTCSNSKRLYVATLKSMKWLQGCVRGEWCDIRVCKAKRALKSELVQSKRPCFRSLNQQLDLAVKDRHFELRKASVYFTHSASVSLTASEIPQWDTVRGTPWSRLLQNNLLDA